MLMTGNVKLCCMVLWDLFCVVANSSILSCPVAFGQTVIFVYYQVAWRLKLSGLLSCALRFHGDVVCPVV